MKLFRNDWYKILFIGLTIVLADKLLENFSSISGVFQTVISVIRPFLIGGLIAFVLYKPSAFLEKKLKEQKNNWLQKNARGIGIAGVYLALIALVFLIGKVIWPAIYRNAEELILELPYYYSRAISFLEEYRILSEFELSDRLRSTLETVLSMESLRKYFGYLSGFASSLVGIFTGLIVSVYMLLEREMLANVFRRVLQLFMKEPSRDKVAKYMRKSTDLFYSYFAGLGLDAILIGVISVPFFYFFKVPYAFLFGALIGICNMIPFFGPIVAAIIIFMLSILSVGPIKAIWILVFQIVLGQIDSNFIQPKIISNSVGISPFWAIFAVLVFGKIWGAAGMIVGVPLIAVARMIFFELEQNRK